MTPNNTATPTSRRGLGRGLGSLIPTAPPQASPSEEEPSGRHTAIRLAPTPPPGSPEKSDTSQTSDSEPAMIAGAYFDEVPVDSIAPNPRQPREVFDEEAMAELVHSVREIGLLQPVVVRRTGDSSYELVMGERRWRATREAGLEKIPAIVRETGDDAMLRDALLENLHRSQLNPLEEASAYRQLLDDFGCTHDDLAGRIGRSRPQISNTLRLLNLSPAVQRRVAAGVLSAGHARALLGVDRSRGAGPAGGPGRRRGDLGARPRGAGHRGRAGRGRTRVRAPRPTAPGLKEIGERLSDRLDTRVKVALGRSKGRVTIEFASLSDLERIVHVIDPRNRDDRPI